ncbi:MAG TPA: deoxyuridine 5'-triphosphate nucleotidohydrolase [Thermomicrobiales bacterium]|nr:deoxyuridine 5'-triphosphate nucleotidohydrolase [Thermomicrobiales bacterium]
MVGALSGDQIRELVQGEQALLSDYLDLNAQLQPNGFDLTLQHAQSFIGAGSLAISNVSRELPSLAPVPDDGTGWLRLSPGPYLITFNEEVRMPADVMALGRPRSSLGRCGVAIHSAVWDAGYHGRSASLLVVSNPAGFNLEIGARLLQLVFFRLERAVTVGYSGTYQGEGLSPDAR